MGEGLGPLGFGLIIVIGGFLIILAVELYYYFLHDKHFSNGHVLVQRRGGMFWPKRVERQHDQYGPVGSFRVSMAARLEDADRDRTFDEGQEDYDSEDSDALHMHLGLGLAGPPHFLYTINEGSAEYMDSEEDARSSRRVGSSCRGSTIFMENEEAEYAASIALTTPFATPPSSPGRSDEMNHSSRRFSSFKILSPFSTKNNDNNNKASFNLFSTLETSSSSFSSTSSDNLLLSPSHRPLTGKTLFESTSSSSSTPLTPLSNSPRMGLRSSPCLAINGRKSPVSGDIATPPSPPNSYHYYYQRIPPSMELTAASSSWRKKASPLLRSQSPKKTNSNIVDGLTPILPVFNFMKEAGASTSGAVGAIANTSPSPLVSDADGFYAYPKSWPPPPLTPPRRSAHSSQSFNSAHPT